ncbi:MAG: ATP-dependent metallopeptidase FtsH/Yme1/Tma family protein, partial [Gammaproteobacteria bacterium]|nr:ATP-dependent metallopeptidase FtsH/Yme1/Tma family protein [Gammaproteobacteria bacterium]
MVFAREITPQPRCKLNDFTKNIILWIIIAVVLLSVFQSFSPTSAPANKWQYSEFLEAVEQGNVDKVVIKG